MLFDSTAHYPALLLIGCSGLLLPCLSQAQATPLILQPDTCVLLADETDCKLTVHISNLPASARQLCLNAPPKPSRCQPLPEAQSELQFDLTLQHNTLLQLTDDNAQVLAEGWLQVVQYQPATRYRRKRGLGWNIL